MVKAQTWAQVLADALLMLEKIPAEHDLVDVMFGTFADGSGHWANMRVIYHLGNTVHANRNLGGSERASRHAERIRLITEAWQSAQQPKEEVPEG